jgi:hypothetical protein
MSEGIREMFPSEELIASTKGTPGVTMRDLYKRKLDEDFRDFAIYTTIKGHTIVCWVVGFADDNTIIIRGAQYGTYEYLYLSNQPVYFFDDRALRRFYGVLPEYE